MMRDGRPTILLIGGGHAHCSALDAWARRGTPDVRIVLLSPDRHTRYSGMIPGTLAGRYEPGAGLIDLDPIAQRVGAVFIRDRCIAIDPRARRAFTASGEPIAFDYASIDTGGTGYAARALGEDPRLVDVRPIASFLSRQAERERAAEKPPRHIAVVGGGAGGIELTFALRQRYAEASTKLTLVAGHAGVLSGFSASVRRLARKELARQGIALVEEDARLEHSALLAGPHRLEPVDMIVAALAAAAPDWLRDTGLELDADGFIAVDRYQRSLSHPFILAAGDVAARQDRAVPHAGVHAVHAGPVLAANLRNMAEGREPEDSYRPRPASLFLLSTGQDEAIASYGPLAAQGRWAARLKHWIDTRWIARFRKSAFSV